MITPEKIDNEDILTISDLRHEQPISKQKPQDQSLYYWYKYIPEDKILYFQYNTCMDKEGAKKAGYKNYDDFDFSGFSNKFMNAVYDNDFNKLIVDLRNNTGGNSSLLSNLLGYLPKDKIVNKNVYILISRNTFSAGVLAILTLKSCFPQSVIIGEETGGNLNTYGDIKSFTLLNCKANLICSTKEFRFLDNLKGGLIPQITIEQSFKDYENGVDPIYDFVRNSK
ncbi:S41 family peptidase [Clostridium lundense]|uniref:S41 family peptidase n=1 Tax=Clostridium lundense TaxID=319475 RepID=UPI00047FEC46|nr:S41 family peptidase [Clostridium lundense]